MRVWSNVLSENTTRSVSSISLRFWICVVVDTSWCWSYPYDVLDISDRWEVENYAPLQNALFILWDQINSIVTFHFTSFQGNLLYSRNSKVLRNVLIEIFSKHCRARKDQNENCNWIKYIHLKVFNIIVCKISHADAFRAWS